MPSLKKITLKQLKLLQAIARHNSFTLAGKEMYLSQPAVSLQIKGLEEAVGEPLFIKTNKRITLTDIGKIVLETAHKMHHEMEYMRAEIDYIKGEVVGALDIAVVTSAKYFLPSFLGEFLQLYPNVTPSLTVTNKETILIALAENRHNLYIMGKIPKDFKVTILPFLENFIDVIAAPSHPLCQESNISLTTLAKERFLVREKGSGTQKATNDLFASKNMIIKPYMELGGTGAIKSAVMANLGIAVMSRHSIQLEHETGRIAILNAKDFPLRRHWYAIYPDEKSLSIVTKTFLDFLITKHKELESAAKP